MSVAKIIEISAESPEGFEAAIRIGIARAAKTVKHIKGAWIQEQQVVIHEQKVAAYRVNMKVTFTMED